MDNLSTQLALLQEIISNYDSISSLTEQLLRVEFDNREGVLARRGDLVKKCEELFHELPNLPLGGSENEIADQKALLNESILRSVSLNEYVIQEMADQKEKMSIELEGASSRNKAAGSYKLHSQFGKKRRDARRTSP